MVDRKNQKQITANSNEKIYFAKPDKKYYWQVQPDPFLANYIYADTIHLKSKTWYRLTIENSAYDKYFFLNGKKGDYIIKEKPKPHAF